MSVSKKHIKDSITIIGSGNLASQLIDLFIQHEIPLDQVLSRSDKKGLSKKYKNKFDIVERLENIDRDASLYFVIVNDDAISDIVKNWPFKLSPHQTIVHCSGSVSSSVFDSIADNYGVFWPIQSIIKDKKIDWSNIPICITANTHFAKHSLKKLASTLSNYIKTVNDIEREKLHMMAVVLNNFTNHIFSLSDRYLSANELPFDIFLPILNETIDRLKDNKPSVLQTGPAIRGDQSTIEKHLELLKDEPQLMILYKMMSDSIGSTK